MRESWWWAFGVLSHCSQQIVYCVVQIWYRQRWSS